MAIGSFLESIDEVQSNKQHDPKEIRRSDGSAAIMLPLEINPLTISAELAVKELETNIRTFLQDVLTIALAHLANQI